VFLIYITFLFGESHNVYSSLRLNHIFGQIPERSEISFRSYLLKDKSSELNHLSNGSFYDQETGVFGFNIGNFNSSWEIADSLFISVKYKTDSIEIIYLINGNDQIEPFLFADENKENYRIIFTNQTSSFQSLSLSQNNNIIFDQKNAEMEIDEKNLTIFLNRFIPLIQMDATLYLSVVYDNQVFNFQVLLDTINSFEINKDILNNKKRTVSLSKPYLSTISGKENSSITISFNFSDEAVLHFYNLRGRQLLELKKSLNKFEKEVHLDQLKANTSAIILLVVTIENQAIYKDVIGVIR
jgi:hypothetical protein